MKNFAIFVWLLLFAISSAIIADEQLRYFNFKKFENRNQYVLVAIPKGHLRQQLNKYWKAVKNSDLNHQIITEAPPHCKLTDFFKSRYTAIELKKVLENTLQTIKGRGVSGKIQVEGIVQGHSQESLDYIKLKAPILKEFAEEFAVSLKPHPSLFVGKNLPFHIKLRKIVLKKHDRHIKIQKLQNKLNLQGPSDWSIAIYKRIGKKLIFVAEQPLELNAVHVEGDYIVVEKNGVIHKFVRFDPATDHFIQNVFLNWENDTFDVFEKVKDSESIAIDIGAWIGTTSIWLSKNFHHVISIEADRLSLKCLEQNLKASECYNISVCNRPIFDSIKEIIFGPRGNDLNESTSYLKEVSDHEKDYVLKSVTLKQLIHEYVNLNDALNTHKIAFIKCDIEGGEENILEDVLQFASNNGCKVYMSFHVDWWKSKKITDFSSLFDNFKTNCPIENVCEYVARNPFASLVFEPKKRTNM